MSNQDVQGFAERSASELDSLYERDFYAWTQEQARLLRELRPLGVDWENAAEEIESLGRSDRHEIRRRMRVLLTHLLKWEFQSAKRKSGWLSTIRDQRTEIDDLTSASPSLAGLPAEVLSKTYEHARRGAADDTGLPRSVFPASCPYEIAQVLDESFLPGRPWSPDELADL